MICLLSQHLHLHVINTINTDLSSMLTAEIIFYYDKMIVLQKQQNTTKSAYKNTVQCMQHSQLTTVTSDDGR